MGAAELLELQRADDRLAALNAEIEAVQSRLRGSEELERARVRAADAAAERDRANAEAAQAEHAGKALRERARVLDRQLYGGSIRNPQELLTLQREQEELRPRIAAADEVEMSLMEAAEAAGAASTEATAEVAAVEEQRRAAAGPDAAQLEQLRRDLDAAVAERDLIASRRTPGELSLYARVAAKHRPAVVRLAGDNCGGCRLPLGMNEVRAVRSRNSTVQCSSCDRIVAP